MNLEQTLTASGFNQKEAKVFLACLKLGLSTASRIARTSRLKRTTVYFVLDRLLDRGIVSTRKTKKTTYYNVTSPGKVLTRLRKQEEQFESILPQLEKLRDPQQIAPKVEMYEGLEGVKQVYKEATQYTSKKEGVCYFGSADHFTEDEEYQDVLNYWLDILSNKKNKACEFVDVKGVSDIEYMKRVKKNANPNHEIRRAPRYMHFLGNDNMIYGDNVALFSARKDVFVVIIRSREIAHNFRTMFELAWKQAVKVK